MNTGLVDKKLRDYLRRKYSEIVRLTGLGKLVRYAQRYRINILVYHNITDEPSPLLAGLPNISPEVFEAQVRFLVENYCVMSVKQLVKLLNSGVFPERSVVLTFDDGFRSVLENAIPILYKYSVSATIFLTTDFLGNHKLSWRSKLEFVLAEGQGDYFIEILRELYLPEETVFLQLDNLVQWTISYFNADLLEQAFNQLFARLGWDEASLAQRARLYFEPFDLLQVDKELIEFGNHTCSHPVLSKMSVEQQQKEIAGAYSYLERHLGYGGFPFAYPFGTLGDYTIETQKICRDSGHCCSLNVSGEAISPRSVSIFDLSRKGVSGIEPPMFQDFLEDILPTQLILRLARLRKRLKRPKGKAAFDR